MHKLRENIDKELKSIEEKGLTSSNLDNAYKLIEMKKGLDKIEMMEQDGGSSYGDYSRDMEDYSNDRGGRGRYSRDGDYSNDYDNGNSYRRGRSATTGRYVHRSNYSRLSGDDEDMERYMKRKSEYSNSRDEGTKNKMLDALEDFMCGVQAMLKQIYKDSDTGEEREIIRKYARQIADM
ncbi:MAG: hypothetical protein NC517_06575 [Firmicutes bacterium]|nr:hypothetical protein [Bacillota bacterium]